MKFLIIVQDLRISGTSEGIVSRSFLTRLKKAYPASTIDVVYIKNHKEDDYLDLLPVNKIDQHFVNRKIPSSVIWLNKFYWRVFNLSLKEKFINQKYRAIIKQINYHKYDHIFVRSSGQGYESILALKDLAILQKAIINFHDPYPVFWDTGCDWKLDKMELNRLSVMWEIVQKAKSCMTPSTLLSQDMEHLYGSSKKFHVLPHQYDGETFPLNLTAGIRAKGKPISISYHGAVQLGRNMDILLQAYDELVNEDERIKENSEFVLRLRGNHTERLKQKFKRQKNIIFLDTIDFCKSANEQANETDILIILENCATHSNILVGKAPFLASLKRPVFCLSPLRSEMRLLIKDPRYIANCGNFQEIKTKLRNLIFLKLNGEDLDQPMGEYFEPDKFNLKIKEILA